MLEFRPVTLKDKAWIDEIVMAENSRSSDFNFGSMYVWDRKYKQLIARCGGRIVTKLRYEGSPAFAFPIGGGDLEPAVLAVKEYADARGWPLRFYGVEEKNGRLLEELFPGVFEYSLQEHLSDYIYRADRLSSYSGRALHGKKNHCNRFEAEHPGWRYEPITRDLIPHCLDMLSCWHEENRERLEPGGQDEYDANVRAFAAYEQLKLEGGAIIADGEMLGLSMGEMCSADCFDVHFEKADISVNGAYAMVCRETAKYAKALHPELEYINREEDMGIPGLAASKRSYCPEYILNKYIARWNND